MAIKNYVLTLSFNGTAYHGWQIQNNAVTVEETVCRAIEKTTGAKPDLTGCSRTDAGVHAIRYTCNFLTDTSIPPERFPYALNTALPDDIRCISCRIEDEAFNSRFSAHSKTYIYKTYTSEITNPFFKDFAYHFPYKCDIENMKKAAEYFLGEHDFSAFMATGGSQKTTVRKVNSLDVEADGETITISINADSYLYNMVRIISGTLLYVGCGKLKAEQIPEIINSKDRTRAGITASACGLYLKEVFYKESDF